MKNKLKLYLFYNDYRTIIIQLILIMLRCSHRCFVCVVSVWEETDLSLDCIMISL